MSRFVVAVTGGIAAGKSEVCRRFKQEGIEIADADIMARVLVEPGQPALKEIARRFGRSVLQADGGLDRDVMRKLVFEQQGARYELESILHPLIRAALQKACDAAQSAYAIAAIPLLAEAGGKVSYGWIDRILVVDVPRDVQVERLMLREKRGREHVELVLAAQAMRDQRLEIADDVIDNSGPPDALGSQIEALHRRYLQLAHASSGR